MKIRPEHFVGESCLALMFCCCVQVTSAIKNSLMASQCGQPAEGPMGISVAISPTTSTTTVSKAIITNASFRTKKLPGLWQNWSYFLPQSLADVSLSVHTDTCINMCQYIWQWLLWVGTLLYCIILYHQVCCHDGN